MQYVLMNRRFGTRITAPSEKARDAILNGKKAADNLPIWKVVQEIDDAPVSANVSSIEELEAMLAAQKAELDPVVGPDEETEPEAAQPSAPKKKRANGRG